MILTIVALAMAVGLTIATFRALSRESKAQMFNSMKMSKRFQFSN